MPPVRVIIQISQCLCCTINNLKISVYSFSSLQSIRLICLHRLAISIILHKWTGWHTIHFYAFEERERMSCQKPEPCKAKETFMFTFEAWPFALDIGLVFLTESNTNTAIWGHSNLHLPWTPVLKSFMWVGIQNVLHEIASSVNIISKTKQKKC